MKLRSAKAQVHVGATTVRATRAPLGTRATAALLGAQSALEVPAKVVLAGDAGQTGLAVELPCSMSYELRSDAALDLLGRTAEALAHTSVAAAREGIGCVGSKAECENELRDIVSGALAALGWQRHAIGGAAYRIGGSGRHAIAVEVCATGFVRVAQPPLNLKVRGADPTCMRALAWFALETNTRLRLARLDVVFGGDADVRASCSAFVPGLNAGGGVPSAGKAVAGSLTSPAVLERDLDLARSAVDVARAETFAALRALSTPHVAAHYLALRAPQLQPSRPRVGATRRSCAVTALEHVLNELVSKTTQEDPTHAFNEFNG